MCCAVQDRGHLHMLIWYARISYFELAITTGISDPADNGYTCFFFKILPCINGLIDLIVCSGYCLNSYHVQYINRIPV